MKIFASYINLDPINGVIFPSYAQNQINKEFIVNKLKGKFYLATNENTYGKNYIILNSLLKEKNLSGVVMLSTFSLPNSSNERKKIYKNCLKFKKTIHFIFEEKKICAFNDIEEIEETLILKNEFFTKKVVKLSKFERNFIDKSWDFV